jgi:hypothetical protein
LPAIVFQGLTQRAFDATFTRALSELPVDEITFTNRDAHLVSANESEATSAASWTCLNTYCSCSIRHQPAGSNNRSSNYSGKRESIDPAPNPAPVADRLAHRPVVIRHARECRVDRRAASSLAKL